MDTEDKKFDFMSALMYASILDILIKPAGTNTKLHIDRVLYREASHLPQQTFYLFISGVSPHEGWNFNSGNYLFTTDTK